MEPPPQQQGWGETVWRNGWSDIACSRDSVTIGEVCYREGLPPCGRMRQEQALITSVIPVRSRTEGTDVFGSAGEIHEAARCEVRQTFPRPACAVPP